MKFYKENHINPAASCLPLRRAAPRLLRALLRAPHFANHPPPGASRGCTSCRASPTRRTRTGRATCCSRSTPAARSSRRYFMSTTMDKAQRTIMMIVSARLHHRRRALPDGPRPLLGDDQPLDGRPGLDHPPARAEDAAARAVRRRSAHVAGPRGERAGRRDAATAPREARRCAEAQAAGAAQPRRVKRKKGGAPPVTGELTVEATGETVSEAKWKALRELERLAPSLDKDAVRFQVLDGGPTAACSASATTPARVLATAAADAAEAGRGARRRTRASSQRACASCSSTSRPRSASAAGSRSTRTDDVAHRGLLRRRPRAADRPARRRRSTRSRRSRTRSSRQDDEDRKQIVVDAAGYRDRRRRDARGARAAAAPRRRCARAAGRARADERRPSAGSCTSG